MSSTTEVELLEVLLSKLYRFGFTVENLLDVLFETLVFNRRSLATRM